VAQDGISMLPFPHIAAPRSINRNMSTRLGGAS